MFTPSSRCDAAVPLTSVHAVVAVSSYDVRKSATRRTTSPELTRRLGLAIATCDCTQASCQDSTPRHMPPRYIPAYLWRRPWHERQRRSGGGGSIVKRDGSAATLAQVQRERQQRRRRDIVSCQGQHRTRACSVLRGNVAQRSQQRAAARSCALRWTPNTGAQPP